MEQPAVNRQIWKRNQTNLTSHAWRRMTARGIPPEAVDAVLSYGRVIYTRGAAISAIGRKEVKHYSKQGINLEPYEGVQVVCSTDGAVMTTYRNQNFRGLRMSCRHSSSRRIRE